MRSSASRSSDGAMMYPVRANSSERRFSSSVKKAIVMKSPVPRRIGLDLDNTIIDYEAIIREEVAGSGLLAGLPAGDKRALRDALRAIEDGEEHWTRLQA